MILDDIVLKRKEQLKAEIKKCSLKDVKTKALNSKIALPSFKKALSGEKMSFICEVKKASPSKGIICGNFKPLETALSYQKAGAAAISCLTEEYYFKGKSEYLKNISQNTDIPVLRKDFIIDEYQIYEARTLGAAAVLLIAAILDSDKLKYFLDLAHGLSLDCLVEVHNESELERVLKLSPGIIGINNRDLKTFSVSLKTTERLCETIPRDKIIVSESGIKSREDVKRVKACGASAVLIGETLMKSGCVSKTLGELSLGV